MSSGCREMESKNPHVWHPVIDRRYFVSLLCQLVLCSGFGKRQEILSNLRNYLVKVRRMFQPIEYLLVQIRADAGEFCEAPGTVDQVFCLFRP